MLVVRSRLSLLFALLLALPLQAQTEASCALQSDPDAATGGTVSLNTAPLLWFPNHDQVNALIVFVQAPNDTFEHCADRWNQGPDGPLDVSGQYATTCGAQVPGPSARYESESDDVATEWPSRRLVNGTMQPARPMWAEKLIDPPGTNPSAYTTGSLSDYYWTMSQGTFRFEGTSYPELIVTEHPYSQYDGDPDTLTFDDWQLITEEVIRRIAEDSLITDFEPYDRYRNGFNEYVPGGDGVFDMLIIHARWGTAVADFGGGDGFYTLYQDTDIHQDAFPNGPHYLGGLRVKDNMRFGSGVLTNSLTRHGAVAMITHEIGHRQLSVHTMPSQQDGRSYGNPFSIMWGHDWFAMDAADRYRLGWLTPRVVSAQTLTRQTESLGDAFLTGDALCISADGACSAEGDLLVEARSHDSYWNGAALDYDGDWNDGIHVVNEGLVVLKRNEPGTFYTSMERTGLPARTHHPNRGVAFGTRHLYGPGDAFTPLSTFRFPVPGDGLPLAQDPALLNDRIAITDIVEAGSGFSFSVWGDFLPSTESRTVRTVYTLGAQSLARQDDWTFGGALHLGGVLAAVPWGTPTITLLPGTVLGIPSGADVTLAGPGSLPVSAGAGSRVEVAGRLQAHRVAFSAANAASGWGGLRFGPGAGRGVPPALASVLTGVSVTGVRYTPGTFTTQYPPRAAVEVRDRAVTLTGGTTITGSAQGYANGMLATGTANVTITGESQIESNAGLGILATAGAQVRVTDGARVSLNALGGVLASGFGTRATMDGYASVDGNGGPGVRADGQAHVRIRSDAGLGNTSVSLNNGGLTAYAGGSVDGGQCQPLDVPVRANRFADNHMTGTNAYDALARGGSSVVARYAYWGAGRTSLVLSQDGSSTLAVYPLAPSVDTPDPSCTVTETGRAGVGAVVLSRSNGSLTGANRGGTPSEAVVALATTAREAAWAGDEAAAFATLAGASAVVATDADREAVFEAMAALMAETQPAATLATLEATASSGGDEAPWARRALAVAHASAGDAAGADALAVELTRETSGSDGISAHAAFGHGFRVRLAVEADSAAMALDRLAALAAVVTDADTLAVETFGSALALVVAAFPDADVSAVAGGARSSMAVPEALLGTTTAGAAADGLAVWPNPAATVGTVRVSVSMPARSAVVAVYDALGRRVVVLHDGPLAAGAHDFALAASALAPGVYVVQVRVVPEDGTAAWTEVRRVTVTR